MKWTGVSVLVTGAGGFIGSHLAEELARSGAKVRAFLRYTSAGLDGNLRFIPQEIKETIEIFRGDLRDPYAVFDAMKGCSFVFHLGALIAIPYSYVHPREVVETNVLGTLNVLEAARVARPERVVHISTSEVYGTARVVPITEEHPLQGQSPYSASKIGADKIAESYLRSFDVPVVTIRPFNTYGPRQSARAIIPTIITQALSSDTVRIGSLEPTRDFTFVQDTARGIAAAAHAPQAVGLEINLGSDQEISIGELVSKICQLLGKEVNAFIEEKRVRPPFSEVKRLRASNARAAEILGWKPSVALSEGLNETIEWIRERPDIFQVGSYEV